MRIVLMIMLAAGLVACDSMELTIAVNHLEDRSLEELPPELSGGLEFSDGWGNRFLYRRLRVDKYNIISSGPDGEFGSADDIVLENGALYDAMKIYAESPLD